ncbi:MAG: hypothetical protein ABFD76_15170 [Smithella sp.]
MELVQSEKTDSIRITEQYVKQKIVVPGDSVKVAFPLVIENNRPVAGKVEVKGDRSKLKVEVTPEGTIEAEAICDEYEVIIKVLQRTIERHVKEAAIYREKESGFQKTIRDLKAILKYGSIALLLFGVLKYAKPFWTILKKLIK